MTESRDVDFAARDGVWLAATLFEPSDGRPASAAVVLNGATAVPRGYYAEFARYLATHGVPTLTYDYRGIGGSRPETLRGFRATMHAWATEDMAGALAFARKRWPEADLTAIGHSSGGWLLGFLPNANEFSRAILVASQSGYWGHWPWPAKARRFLDWHVFLPAAAHLVGYVPGKLGLGEDLPKDVALEWARWCRRSAFTADDPRADYGSIRFPVVAYSFPDDAYAPPRAVDALCATFENSNVTLRRPEGRPIGHFGFFRPKTGAHLWPEILRDLGVLPRG